MSSTKSIRFGVTDGKRHSEYWKVSAMVQRPELVIAGNRTGHFLHVTMHEDERYWHIKVVLPEGTIERTWTPPTEIQPGVRRLLQLRIPYQAVRNQPPKGAHRVVWLPAPPDERTWVECTVLHCVGGIPAIKNATAVGGVTLADGSAALAIARHAPATSGSHTFRVPDVEEAKRILSRPDIGALIHGVLEPDGCLVFLQVFTNPRSV